MTKPEFTKFVEDVSNTKVGELLIIYVDHEGEQVEIRRKERDFVYVRRHGEPLTYASTLYCRCHWSEAQAWYNGWIHGPNNTLKDVQIDDIGPEDLIRKLKDIGMYLVPKRDNPIQFNIVSRPTHRPDLVLYENDNEESSPTYETLGQIERWLEGRMKRTSPNVSPPARG